MLPVGAVSNRTGQSRLETAPTRRNMTPVDAVSNRIG